MKFTLGQEVSRITNGYAGDISKITHLTVTKVTKTSVTTSDGARWTGNGDLWGADSWSRTFLTERADGLKREAAQAAEVAARRLGAKVRELIKPLDSPKITDRAAALEHARRLVAFLESGE